MYTCRIFASTVTMMHIPFNKSRSSVFLVDFHFAVQVVKVLIFGDASGAGPQPDAVTSGPGVRVNNYPQGDVPWVGNPDPYAACGETAPLDRAGTLGPVEP